MSNFEDPIFVNRNTYTFSGFADNGKAYIRLVKDDVFYVVRAGLAHFYLFTAYLKSEPGKEEDVVAENLFTHIIERQFNITDPVYQKAKVLTPLALEKMWIVTDANNGQHIHHDREYREKLSFKYARMAFDLLMLEDVDFEEGEYVVRRLASIYRERLRIANESKKKG